MVGRTRLYRFLQTAASTLDFGSETIDDQALVVGTAASLTLPEATGGTGTITYSLSPTLPTGSNLHSWNARSGRNTDRSIHIGNFHVYRHR